MKIASSFKVFIKFSLFALVLLNYFIVSSVIVLFFRGKFVRARPYLTKAISFTGKLGLKIIGIKVVQKYETDFSRDNFLVVSNHLSYVDVLAISSFLPSCFVTSKEMKNTFFLGQLCMIGGCLFVDRKKKSNIHNEVRELTQALDRGLNVAIFPEATSTDGTQVRVFKRPLFQAAIDAEAKILPICLNYKSIDGEDVTLKTRDSIFWYDDTPFIVHALKLFRQKNIILEISVLPAIQARSDSDKLELSEKCQQMISAEYKQVVF